LFSLSLKDSYYTAKYLYCMEQVASMLWMLVDMGVLHFSISLMNRLNQSKYTIFTYKLCFQNPWRIFLLYSWISVLYGTGSFNVVICWRLHINCVLITLEGSPFSTLRENFSDFFDRMMKPIWRSWYWKIKFEKLTKYKNYWLDFSYLSKKTLKMKMYNTNKNNM
jgi:hypothetical protein